MCNAPLRILILWRVILNASPFEKLENDSSTNFKASSILISDAAVRSSIYKALILTLLIYIIITDILQKYLLMNIFSVFLLNQPAHLSTFYGHSMTGHNSSQPARQGSY